jgi:hypothetical protein
MYPIPPWTCIASGDSVPMSVHQAFVIGVEIDSPCAPACIVVLAMAGDVDRSRVR